MSSLESNGPNRSDGDTVLAHLPEDVRNAIAITPAAGTRERIVDDLNQPHDPGTIRPTSLRAWAESRLMQISFP